MTKRPGILTFVAAILLPPLGVYLDRGLAPAFWIAVALTLIGYVPGAIFALIVLIAPDILPPRLLIR
jgi:uncharacterized membrane protein YqaE (UPF0057 family)